MQQNIIMGDSSYNAVINYIVLSYIFHHVHTHPTSPPQGTHTHTPTHTSHECNNESFNCHKIVIWIYSSRTSNIAAHHTAVSTSSETFKPMFPACRPLCIATSHNFKNHFKQVSWSGILIR